MLTMFTRATRFVKPMCININIYGSFWGCFPPSLVFSIIPFVISFRRLCTGVMNVNWHHVIHKFRVCGFVLFCFFNRFTHILVSAVCPPAVFGVDQMFSTCHVTFPPQTSSLCHASNLCPLCVCYGNYCIFLKVFFSLNKKKCNLQWVSYTVFITCLNVEGWN